MKRRSSPVSGMSPVFRMYSFLRLLCVRPVRFAVKQLRAHPKLSVLAGIVMLVTGWTAVNAWAWWNLDAATAAFEKYQFDDAERHLAHTLRVWPNSFSAHLLAARIERRRGHFADAEHHLVCCKKQRGITEEVQIEWLLLRALTGDFLDLERVLLNAVTEGNPANGAILETLAMCYLKQHRLLRAKAVLDLWLKKEPDTPAALFLRGWTLRLLHMRDEAYADFKRAIELNPSNRQARLRFADFLLADKHVTEAAEHLEMLLADNAPPEVDFWLTVGVLRLQQGKLDEAQRYLDDVLQAQPAHTMALYQRGLLEMQRAGGDRVPDELHHLAEAETFFRRALKESPANNLARYSLYQCLQRQPERKQDARRELAIYQANADEERASEKLFENLETFPKNPDLLVKAAKYFMARGELTLARDYLHRAVNAQPDHPLANRLLSEWNEQARKKHVPGAPGSSAAASPGMGG
jgi:Tfp pilus assembly protein PilF